MTGLRLLVVEDTPVNRQVAQELLSNEGAHVEVAESGRKGVEKALAAKPPFDAVLMDIQMPDIDGYVASRMIRKNSRMQLLPILAMTANVMAADKAACFAAGMNDHIAKPIDLEDLVKTILRQRHPNQTFADISTTEAATMSQHKLGIEFEAALKRLGGNKSLFISLAQRFGADVASIIVNLRQNLEQKNKLALLA